MAVVLLEGVPVHVFLARPRLAPPWVSAIFRWTRASRPPAPSRVQGGARGARRSIQSGSLSSPTGAIGGFVTGYLTKRLVTQADFLYIKVTSGDTVSSVTDWRLGLDDYFLRNAGLAVQYKYNRYTYDRGIIATKLGGEITYQGIQLFLTFRF